MAELMAESGVTATSKPSASISTGRSACRNVPIATSTATCGASRSTSRVSCAPFTPRSRPPPSARAGRTVSTIFFGGGTPSLMQPATIAGVLNSIARHWRVAPDAEITLEANPTSVEATRFRGYRAAGVNRVSLGVQALDDRVLAELGRMHSAREALDAVAIARSVFDRYSFDLIYARPGQEPKDWASELQRGAGRGRRAPVALSTDHRAGHAVCRAPCRGQIAAARRGHRARALRHDPGDLRRARPAGLRDFQSCAARRRMPAQSRLLARPRICRHRARARMAGSISTASGMPPQPKSGRKPGSTRVEAHGHGLVTDDVLTREERSDEFLLMGLRLAEGIDIARYTEDRRPPARSGPHRHAARAWPGRDHAGGPPAGHVAGLPGARCGGRRSRGVAPDCADLLSLAYYSKFA